MFRTEVTEAAQKLDLFVVCVMCQSRSQAVAMIADRSASSDYLVAIVAK